MLVPPCNVGDGEHGGVSMVVLHCGINQKHNPTLIPNTHQTPANTDQKQANSLARALAMLYEFQAPTTPSLSCILLCFSQALLYLGED